MCSRGEEKERRGGEGGPEGKKKERSAFSHIGKEKLLNNLRYILLWLLFGSSQALFIDSKCSEMGESVLGSGRQG